MAPRQSRFGLQAPQPTSVLSEVAYEPRGLDWSQQIADIPLGAARVAKNLTIKNGGIERRPVIRRYPSTNTATDAAPMATQVLGGAEIISVTGVPRQIVSGTTNWAWFSNGSWSRLSYVSAGGISDPPSLSTYSYWDIIQTYDPVSDEMLAVGAPGSYQSLYCWKSGSTLFSTLTTAPRAKYVASYDNYLMALNVRDPASANSIYVQRVQWSHRGEPSNWTSGLAGFEDLLDMKGQGTRILADGRRVVIFSDEEIWQGVTGNAPFQFLFSAIDRSVGCPYPWTVAQTPAGIIFLGRGLQVYLLPADGGTAQPIGQKIVPFLRNVQVTAPERAWAVYDSYTNTYRLHYKDPTGDYPRSALWLHLDNGEWTQQKYDDYLSQGPTFDLTRGWAARETTSSNGTAWNASGFSGTYTWDTVPGTWNQFAASNEYGPRTVFMGSSTGTILKEWPELSFDADLDTHYPYARWLGNATDGANGWEPKQVMEVALDFERINGNTSMQVTVTSYGGNVVSRQNITLGSSAGDQFRQQTAYINAVSRYPEVELLSTGWFSNIKRIGVRFRRGGYSQANY